MDFFPQGVPWIKRTVDLVISLIGLMVLSPFFLIISIILYLFQGAPVLFLQKRPGLDGKTFELIKFRTMQTAFDEHGHPLSDSERITALGRFLRATSLDELPELINVLKGDMSLVGPRPLLLQYLDRYNPEQARRHEVLPGITGWAQINGRNALSWEDKFSLDVWYVDHWSAFLDLRILLATLWKVLKQEGISQPGHSTAEEFMGSHDTGDSLG